VDVAYGALAARAWWDVQIGERIHDGRSNGNAQTTAGDVLEQVQVQDVRVIDLKFTDLPGAWQHLGLSARALDEATFTAGIGFDGSSIRGFQRIDESDMLLIPDPTTAVLDPFHEQRTLSLVCDVIDPITREPYTRDPRHIARKAERHLSDSRIADRCYVGPEAEFYIFDSVSFGQRAHTGFYEIDSCEGYWNGGRSQHGYYLTPPADEHSDLRDLMLEALEQMGIPCETQHHEVGSAGQAEINLHFTTLLQMADRLQMQKYVVRNVAHRAGKSATFMPKPLFQENGSGMHVHLSLSRAGRNVMHDADGYAQLSRQGLHYIGGLLRHGRALMALCAPTTNSYRRLVPGYEAPVNLAYSRRNRSAAVRIPMYSGAAETKRIEFRPPDPTANPYLAFSALMMAGLDGIRNQIDPGAPLDQDLFELPAAKLAGVPSVPASLEEALDALESDHAFLLEGGVFTTDLIETWVELKRRSEADEVRLRPHPWEFALYYES
jgi:glutamine synthetase